MIICIITFVVSHAVASASITLILK